MFFRFQRLYDRSTSDQVVYTEALQQWDLNLGQMSWSPELYRHSATLPPQWATVQMKLYTDQANGVSVYQ